VQGLPSPQPLSRSAGEGLGGCVRWVFFEDGTRRRFRIGLDFGIEVRPRPGRDEVRANATEHVLGVFEDVAVEEAQDREPEALEPVIARGVPSSFASVRSPVGFDHEPGFGAEEVDDEGPDGVLATKLRARKPSIAEQLPQRPLGRRRSPSQSSGSKGLGTTQVWHVSSSTRPRRGFPDRRAFSGRDERAKRKSEPLSRGAGEGLG
jgi:hypothetical protein